MTINPCCIPLKTGVRMVTHLSMALALCVGWTGVKLISISWEVSSSLETQTPITYISPGSPQGYERTGGGGGGSGYPNPNPYNIFQPPPIPPPPHHHHHQDSAQDQFRIPYEYILYQKWHQHQQQMRQNGGGGGGGAPHGQYHYSGDISSVYPTRYVQPAAADIIPPHHQEGLEGDRDHQDGSLQRRPPPLLPPPHPPQNEPDDRDEEDEGGDEEDKQSKIFRSVLLHRKNFKEVPERDEGNVEEATPRSGSAAGTQLQLPKHLSSPLQQRREEDGIESDYHHRHHQDFPQAQQQQQHPDLHHLEMNRMMMRANSQKEVGSNIYKSRNKFPDFHQQYAKVLLICGLLALCTVVFQFLTSFLLLCFVDKGSNAAAQIWTAVNCSVIFCLATCLVLFLCEGMSMPKYSFDETLYLSFVTVDSLLSIYFLWVVMAFI